MKCETGLGCSEELEKNTKPGDEKSEVDGADPNIGIETNKVGPNSQKSKKKWSTEEDKLLLKLAEQTKGKKWKWISSKIPGKRDSQCRSRWERIKPGMKQGRWTPEEDQLLQNLYKEHGDKWSDIAKFLVNRTGKQVRDRFKNVYDPNISRQSFSKENDELVYKLYLERGPKWKDITTEFFPDRTADFIKNRFYSNYNKMKSKFGEKQENKNSEKPENPNFSACEGDRINLFLDKNNKKTEAKQTKDEQNSLISPEQKVEIASNSNFLNNGSTKSLNTPTNPAVNLDLHSCCQFKLIGN